MFNWNNDGQSGRNKIKCPAVRTAGRVGAVRRLLLLGGSDLLLGRGGDLLFVQKSPDAGLALGMGVFVVAVATWATKVSIHFRRIELVHDLSSFVMGLTAM